MTAPVVRPRLLIAAARHAAATYDPAKHRRGLLPGQAAGSLGRADAVARLRLAEGDAERARREDRADYRPGRHVATLGALLAEAAALGAPAFEPGAPDPADLDPEPVAHHRRWGWHG